MKSLPEEKRLLLSSILDKRHSKLLPQLENSKLVITDPKYAEDLIDIICDELAEFGLDANDEPNNYGLQLEELIDALNDF